MKRTYGLKPARLPADQLRYGAAPRPPTAAPAVVVAPAHPSAVVDAPAHPSAVVDAPAHPSAVVVAPAHAPAPASTAVVHHGLPEAVDLRHRCPPVYDQGELGSCTANALAAAAQFVAPALRGSRLFLYYNERVADGDVQDDAGSTLSTGVACLSRQGLCPEADWPYDVRLFRQPPPSRAYADGVAHRFPRHAHVLPEATSMRACLAAGYPFVVGILVYESFESDRVARTGAVPMPSPGAEQCLGGHAVLCVGYDMRRRVWIMRNSWGASWGDRGYFYLPLDYLTSAQHLASDMWCILP